MTLPNDSHATTPGSGTTWATHLVNGKEYPVGMSADPDGHLHGSLPAWSFIVPPAAVGASKIFFDLHNAQATTVLRLRKLFAIIATDAGVTATVAFRLDVMRTSTAGTGGTTWNTTGTSAGKTTPAFWPFTPGTALPAGITGRSVPTGAAADQTWLWPSYFGAEETNVATGAGGVSAYLNQYLNLMPEMPFGQAIELPTGNGLKVVQGTVASAGNVGFLGCFTIE